VKLRDFANKRWTGGVNLLLHRGRNHLAHVFDAMVEDINALGVEHVACTGDITNLSLASEFRFARSKFDRFAVGADDVTCIPGNHDTYIDEVDGLFEKEFEAFCAGDPEWEWKDGGDKWPIVRVRGNLAVIACSSCHPVGWFAAHGRLGGRQLHRLETALGDPRLAGKFRLVLIHHPPAGKRARNPLRGLKDHAAFGQILSRHGAELVLHGHEHRDVREALHGPHGAISVRGIQSGSYHSDDHHKQSRYRVYSIGAGPTGSGRPVVVAEELRVFKDGRFQSEGVLRWAA
jgi:3',5'-cyclic AMP phosphodiesterase CpdA